MILGIDPGSSSGAFAIIDKDKNFVYAEEFKTEACAAQSLKKYKEHIIGAVLEQVHSMPKQGISSAFSFGGNFGFWRGLLYALEIPFILVTPQKWQASMFDSNKKGESKSLSLNMVQRLYPSIQFVTDRGRAKHGESDAVLMALYGLKISQF